MATSTGKVGGFLRAVAAGDGGSSVSYQISGRHAIALALSLWAVFRKSAAVGGAVLWAIAIALGAREWIGGPVTLPSARHRVPLLHDASALRGGAHKAGLRAKASRGYATAAQRAERETASADVGEGIGSNRDVSIGGAGKGGCSGEAQGSRGEGAGGGEWMGERGGWAGNSREVPVCLAGARVEIVEWAVRGHSGFDRFCVKVHMLQVAAGSEDGELTTREWIVWRRLTEFVALRYSINVFY